MNAQPPRLLDQVRQCLRYKHYSLSTEKIYVYWIRFFIRWSGLRDPKEMGALELESFLTMLTTERQVSPSTHRQALSAILFLYKEVLKLELPWLQGIGRPQSKQRLPVVLTALEIEQLFQQLDASNRVFGLFAKLLYGTGMRIMQAAHLRTKDIDFETKLPILTQCCCPTCGDSVLGTHSHHSCWPSAVLPWVRWMFQVTT